eukprot:949206-Pyramimonas_sp.AAC.1
MQENIWPAGFFLFGGHPPVDTAASALLPHAGRGWSRTGVLPLACCKDGVSSGAVLEKHERKRVPRQPRGPARASRRWSRDGSRAPEDVQDRPKVAQEVSETAQE